MKKSILNLNGVEVLSKHKMKGINGAKRTCYKELGTMVDANGNKSNGIMITCFNDNGSVTHYNILGQEVFCP
ncbi:hypothetical protein [Flavobacterium sp. HNIBRBA15423]|uniref:hypothetical protein n=1 Tax=Flavobacterium sp. HNIBRBA15423 TaxID=3458683 RepID=UPI004044DF09